MKKTLLMMALAAMCGAAMACNTCGVSAPPSGAQAGAGAAASVGPVSPSAVTGASSSSSGVSGVSASGVGGAGGGGGSGTGGASGASVGGNSSRAFMAVLPNPVSAAPLPAVRCPSESEASAWVWSFWSSASSNVDAKLLCAAADLADVLWKQCQFESSIRLTAATVKKHFGVDIDPPAGMANLPADQCNVVVPAKKDAAPKRISLSAGALFDTGRADLTAAGRSALDGLVAQVKAAKPETVRVVGHTDAVGSHAFNDDLSRRRAEAVRAYLASSGVMATSIVADGRGKREPVASNATAEGRASNRRVVVDFVGAE